ncbi:MAG: ferric reductase-like transmembrane domain-containing protein [Gemmatimonadaceae bacterium]
MDAISISSDAGLVALTLLTANFLIGLLLSTKYNPVRRWPHRRINTVKIHNWTAYLALAVAVLHPVLILFSATAGFGVVDLLYPIRAPKQPFVNTLGALGLYALVFIVVTSYFRFEIGRRRWKILHFTAYGLALLVLIHGIVTDPKLKDSPLDPLDGEKVYVELCALLILVAVVLRIRWHFQQGPPRVHRPKA